MIDPLQRISFNKRHNKNDPYHRVISSGEGGIRTHGTLRYTRSPSARVRPTTQPLLVRFLAIARDYIMVAKQPPAGQDTINLQQNI